LKNSVAICITKTENFIKKEIMCKLINDLLKFNNLFSEEAKKLIEYSLKSIFLFKKPIEEGPINEQILLKEIDDSIEYLDLKPLKQ